MKPLMLSRLEKFSKRLKELDFLLTQEEIHNNIKDYCKKAREHALLYPIVELYNNYKKINEDIITAKEMLNDLEMKNFALDELNLAKKRIFDIELELKKLILPKDKNDKRNIFIEIRAGTGGDESALFVNDLLKMYTRFSERNYWKFEIISRSLSEIGGYKEVIIRIIGLNVYSKLKFESGVHRVQRVPKTETQGRVHTSACTVAVIPESDEIEDINIDPSDLRIDTYRASGAGGQHINKTDSAVRITHIPTGIVVQCQNDRSQHKNKAFALKILSARIKDSKLREQQSNTAEIRRLLIGSGDRSERIRTYNFPQGRMTDHRINLTLYKLDYIMDGDLEEIINALLIEHQSNLIENLFSK
ncbi:peptide chain release factor 1 [Candidatus Profftella armatura (Diaphorina cf. continua)]|uniref:Peptide chain release factor 1 n=1 Tax=Candidatus Profftella armatura (Diaphorina cf. continua) TaxID=2661583 RepID=A0A7R6W0I4_9PROT|nr:peptide chain release factor 1 [Candidatus Profftella armatura (Diaphorina cf. continua)]BCG49602.1 peptide chain release factor 1 [Candidatus Profftella armatura (Diaphorina cf. continua)]